MSIDTVLLGCLLLSNIAILLLLNEINNKPSPSLTVNGDIYGSPNAKTGVEVNHD
jgi:hypothetical protein